MAVLSSLVIIFIKAALAVPLGHAVSPESTLTISTESSSVVGFVGDPNQRGTYSLVISCLLTLVLCVWSALHLNVPHPDDTVWYRFWVNTRWIFTGVYAPELVVFTAWRQWSSAKILGRKVQEAKSSSPRIDKQPRHQWTMAHNFFASTGGFAFELDESSHSGPDAFLPAACPRRLTLTARGMAFLSACGHLPDVPRVDIMDKSKANNLAKALVIIQASWLLIQVVGRLIAKLPVTVLEVNTVAHVMCAFLMYAMWWHKPLSPNEPFILKGDWIPPLCAFMFMTSEMSGSVDEQSLKSQTSIKTMFAFLHLYSKVPEIELLCLRRPVLPSGGNPSVATPSSKTTAASERTSITCDREESCPNEQHSNMKFAIVSSTCLEELRHKRLDKAAGTAFFERRPRVTVPDLDDTTVADSSQRRWDLAIAATRDYPVILDHHLLHTHDGGQCMHFCPEELLVARVQNWPWDDLLRDVGGLVVGLVLWLANFGYGAIHAAAWNDHFPTTAEKWLWRSSAVYIGFCGGLWIILNYMAQAYRPLNEFWEKWMDGKKKAWQNALIGIPVVLCGASLLFARAFLVIEAFVSVRELPASAYVTPAWSQVFPHL
ncbi:MAG: hypothetical protein LQ341_005821 [Variospora aurantia]|nr:MAG: hypothetical protein LQ341_005821 [Variospora aurantia]